MAKPLFGVSLSETRGELASTVFTHVSMRKSSWLSHNTAISSLSQDPQELSIWPQKYT